MSSKEAVTMSQFCFKKNQFANTDKLVPVDEYHPAICFILRCFK